jgi:hypothetical protein
MSSTTVSLDALCEGLLASFIRANRMLASMPLPGDAMGGGPVWRDDSDAPIPWHQFCSKRRMQLQSAELVLACFASRKTAAGPVTLSTHPPAWWRRLLGLHAALELRIAVTDGVCAPRFCPVSGAQTPAKLRRQARLHLTLNPQQQAELAALQLQAMVRHRDGVLARLWRWLRRLTENATI